MSEKNDRDLDYSILKQYQVKKISETLVCHRERQL